MDNTTRNSFLAMLGTLIIRLISDFGLNQNTTFIEGVILYTVLLILIILLDKKENDI